MERQVSHLNRLVDDLLEVSRITRGVIEVKKEPHDLGAIVKGAVETSRPILDGMRHELTFLDRRASRWSSPAMPVRLTQVFSNLLNNAAKYTNHGGHITVAIDRDGDQAVVIGQATTASASRPNLLSSVFDMFMQVDRSTRRAQGGLGIGLTLVQEPGRHAWRQGRGAAATAPAWAASSSSGCR